MKGLAKSFALLLSFAGLLGGAANANAVACNSLATGNWGTIGTWSCGHVPLAVDDVTIAAGHTVTLAAAPTPVLSLTLSAATSTLATGANILTVTGNLVINGTVSGTGSVYSNGPALTPITISGTGTFSGVRLYTSGTGGTTIPVGSNINFLGTSRLYAGNNGGGALAGSVLIVNGTITAASTVSLRAYTGTAAAPGFIVGSTGVINATGATFAVRAAAAFANNGSVTLASVTGANATTSIWTNNANSTLNVSGALMATGVLTASAAGNTVNYNGVAQTVKPAIYNNLTLSGSGAKTTATVTVNGILSMEGTATASVAPTYGAAATLQYNTATARAAGVEWITPFAGTGGIIIANTGAITLNAAKVFNASVPLTINSGATLNTSASNFGLTFGGNFINNGGTLTANASPIVIANIMATQSIDGFTTTGLVSMTKTAGTATFAGNVNGAGLTINGIGGTLDLGAGLTHTFTGAWTRTNGTLNGGSSTLNVGGSCSGAGGTFTAGTGTVNWNAAGAQTVCQYAYNNLTLSNSGAKTMTGVTAIAGDLSIAGAATMTGNAAFTVGGALNYSSTGATTLAAPIVIGSYNQTAGTFSAGANAISVSGNWNETGTFNPGTGTVTLNGATAQTISGTSPVNFNNLTVTNGANPNITLATNVTVAGTLTGTVNLTSTCPTDYTLTSTTPVQVLHSCPPTALVSSINLADASPTSAATVSWTVIFNQSVTGVDATAFALAPSGVSGAYITSVTGSGSTWTVTANTGIGSGTLGLNQTGPGSVVPTLTGTFTGQVYTISSTPALAEYRMDEASWNGTANEVVDSSGNGNHAQAFNLANTEDVSRAIPGSPGTCRNGVFDNGTTISQGYVQTPLPNLTTDFTVSAWIRTTDNTIGAQRIMIDDQGTAPATGYGFSLGEAGTGKLRFYSRGITPISFDSTYTIANNTWYFVAAVADITNKKRTIYVFDAAGTLLNSTPEAAAFTGTWGTDGGPVSIGAETNASAETPAANHFKGNIDEVRVYQKVLGQSALAAIATQTHACPINIPDHLEIQSSGSGLTCAASTLTIKACTDAAIPCATPYTLGVSGTLTATGAGMTVNWDGTTGGATGAGFVIPNGSSSVTKDVQVVTAGSVVFGITSPSPTPTNATTCNFGAPVCTFTANTAGFIFSNTTTGNSYTIPAQVSGIATPTLYLRAVQALTTNAAVCTPAIISQTTAVNMGYVCNNPATCQAGNLATITNTITSTATAIAPGGTSVSLNFDANGSAPITARYDDVGQITLNANKTVTPPNGTAVTLTGSSNPFVVAPHHFGFSNITPGLIKAGNNFSATVTAYNGLATPTVTPNFGKESVAEGVTLTSNLGVGNNPAISNNVIPGSEFGAGGMVNDANGVATVNNLSWGEVGLITLTANLTSGNYLGSALTATGTSGNVGRFIPDHFDTAVVLAAGVPMTCPTGLTCPALYNGFGYSGQAFSVQVTAKNLADNITTNYDSTIGFSKNVTLTAWDAKGSTTTQNPGPGSLNVAAPLAAADFVSGVGVRKVAGNPTPYVTYTFDTTPTNPTDIYVRAADTDSVISLRAVAANSVEGGIKVASGRVKIGNAYGSELLQLPMTATVQYNKDGTANGWVTSTTDAITTFNTNKTPGGNLVPVIVKVPLALANINVAGAGAVTVAGGVRTFTLTAPGITGSADISLNAPSYLLAGSNGAAVNPSIAGRATFGVYKGRNEFIYMRENY